MKKQSTRGGTHDIGPWLSLIPGTCTIPDCRGVSGTAEGCLSAGVSAQAGSRVQPIDVDFFLCTGSQNIADFFQSIQSASNRQSKNVLNYIHCCYPDLVSYFGCATLRDLRYCTWCLDSEVPGLSLKRTENPSIHGEVTLSLMRQKFKERFPVRLALHCPA